MVNPVLALESMQFSFLIASFISICSSFQDNDLNIVAGKSRDVRNSRQDLEKRYGVVALLAPELSRATHVAYDVAEQTEKDFSAWEASGRSKRAPGQGRRQARSDEVMSGEMESSEENGPSGGQRRGGNRNSNNRESGANMGDANNMESSSRGRGNRGRGKGRRGMKEKPERNMESGNDMESSSGGRGNRGRGKEKGGTINVQSERNKAGGNDMESSSRGRGNRGRGGRERGGMNAERVRNRNDERRSGQEKGMDGEVPKTEPDGIVFNSNMDLGV